MIKSRGEMIDVLNQVNLTINFKDQLGNLIDTDSYPTVSITQPSGLLLLAPTSVGVSRASIGSYSFIFTVPYAGSLGVYTDNWIGYVGGIRVEGNLQFVVTHSDIPGINQ